MGCRNWRWCCCCWDDDFGNYHWHLLWGDRGGRRGRKWFDILGNMGCRNWRWCCCCCWDDDIGNYHWHLLWGERVRVRAVALPSSIEVHGVVLLLVLQRLLVVIHILGGCGVVVVVVVVVVAIAVPIFVHLLPPPPPNLIPNTPHRKSDQILQAERRTVAVQHRVEEGRGGVPHSNVPSVVDSEFFVGHQFLQIDLLVGAPFTSRYDQVLGGRLRRPVR